MPTRDGRGDRPNRPDSVDEAREAREALERAERMGARRDPRREDSDPPVPPRRVPTGTDWPPHSVEDYRPGAGSPRVEPPPIEQTGKAFDAAWKIVATLVAAATLGWSAHAYWTKPIIATAVEDGNKPLVEEMKQLRKELDVNQRSNESTFAGIAKDIDWLKRERKVVESEPIKSERKR